ncbi:MAG: dolichol-phosphate mannosyltransferase [Acidobacteriota bacterium]|jgi:dolichol-phosphate mannosyltransferase/undecaprenyl-phosphate 4-deoxy-4-formamido-L-arabinose transferase|nr:dolichol-phosphate mannosyltransferase [Acidobacteriota bacterium]
MRVSIVIPVYDSPVLEELADSIEAVFRARPEDDYEIVFVDDRSPDPRIWPTLMRLAGERKRVRAIQLTRNFGQQAATLCGLSEARGEAVVTLDDDLQHDPRDIPKLLAYADRDIVIGQFERKRHSLARRTSSRIKGFFDRILIGKPRGIQLSSFRLLGRTVVDGILSIRTPHPFLPALMFHVSKDVVGVPVGHGDRRGGRSGYTLRKLFRVFSNLLFNNSSFLLRLVGVVGISFAALSFFLAAVVIYRKIVHSVNVQGWTSLFATLLLIGGLLLVSLGVVGEYLLRIIESSENRPTYLVRRRLGFPEEPG